MLWPLPLLLAGVDLCRGAGATDVALPLGDYNFYGLGGLQGDVSEAARLYGIAADAGNAQAAYNLGYLVLPCVNPTPMVLLRVTPAPPLLLAERVRRWVSASQRAARAALLQPRDGAGAVPWRASDPSADRVVPVRECAAWARSPVTGTSTPAHSLFRCCVKLCRPRIQARNWLKAKGLWVWDGQDRLEVSTLAMNASYIAAADTLSNSLVSQWVQWCLDTHKAADKEGEQGDAHIEETAALVACAVLFLVVIVIRGCRRRCARKAAAAAAAAAATAAAPAPAPAPAANIALSNDAPAAGASTVNPIMQ